MDPSSIDVGVVVKVTVGASESVMVIYSDVARTVSPVPVPVRILTLKDSLTNSCVESDARSKDIVPIPLTILKLPVKELESKSDALIVEPAPTSVV